MIDNDEDDGNAGFGVAPEPRRVLWEMEYQDGRKEIVFEHSLALAALLIDERVFLNNHMGNNEWPDEAKKVCSINVICNDVFAWGCADAEEVYYKELKDLWEHYEKDPRWGTAVWCMKKRNELPQQPVYVLIQDAGIWDLDSLGLNPYQYDTFLKSRVRTG